MGAITRSKVSFTARKARLGLMQLYSDSLTFHNTVSLLKHRWSNIYSIKLSGSAMAEVVVKLKAAVPVQALSTCVPASRWANIHRLAERLNPELPVVSGMIIYRDEPRDVRMNTLNGNSARPISVIHAVCVLSIGLSSRPDFPFKESTWKVQVLVFAQPL